MKTDLESGDVDFDVLGALNALAAPDCPKCSKPLAPGQVVCCNTLLCPFCRRRMPDADCRHVVAWRVDGRWTIPGVLTQKATVPSIELDGCRVIEWSPAQKQTALGVADSVVHQIWGEGLAVPPQPYLVRSSLVSAVRGTVTGAFNDRGRYQILAFHADPKAFVDLGRALVRAWTEGMEALKHTAPEASRRLLGTFPLEPLRGNYDAYRAGWTRHTRAPFLVFAPDGKSLAVGVENRVELRAVPSGELLWTCVPERDRAPLSAVFLSDGQLLAVQETCDHGTRTATWLLDTATGDVRAVLDPMDGNGQLHTGTVPMVALHGGTALLDIGGRVARVARLDAGGEPVGVEALVHRVPIKGFGASPDGETFATIAQSTLLLWRIPREDEPAPSSPG